MSQIYGSGEHAFHCSLSRSASAATVQRRRFLCLKATEDLGI